MVILCSVINVFNKDIIIRYFSWFLKLIACMQTYMYALKTKLNPVSSLCPQFLLCILVFITGLKEFLQLGIPADKLVLGLPWYGYDYPCLHYTKVCECFYRITLVKTWKYFFRWPTQSWCLSFDRLPVWTFDANLWAICFFYIAPVHSAIWYKWVPDYGGYICVNNLHTLIWMWLNASQRFEDGVY